MAGCTAEMKQYGEQTFLGQPFGNCIQPTPGTEFVEAVDQGLAFSYLAPQITAITPSGGVNMANTSFDITIHGSNMGGAAREIQRQACLTPAKFCQDLGDKPPALCPSPLQRSGPPQPAALAPHPVGQNRIERSTRIPFYPNTGLDTTSSVYPV